MRNHAPLSALSFLVVSIAACGGGGSTTVDGGSSSPLGFTPSNVDLSGFDLSNVGDVVISGANCGIMDTEALSWSCVDAPKFVAKTLTLQDQTKLSVFVVRSLRIEASAVMNVSGGHVPVAVIALDSMTLLGSIKLRPGYVGGAYNALPDMKGAGPGGGGGGPGSDQVGGGGGSFCGIGGAGGVDDKSGKSPYAKSSAYGSPTLIPLVGGSAGGRGNSFKGHAGGAIELVAGNVFELKAGAFVSAVGMGGVQAGLAAEQESGGGGSGGAILIEAKTVKIAGTLSANGGGGGGGTGGTSGSGKDGDDGHDADATPAAGGTGGGVGAAGDTANGADGLLGVSTTATGGGGGAGRIRINTLTGSADVGSALLTPSAKSQCFSQGTVAK